MLFLRNTIRNRQLTTKIFFLFTVAVGAFVVMLLPSKAAAATFTVTTLADNESNGCGTGQCTLREAITAANSTTQADTITFAAGASNGTIFLTGGQLTISAALTISGPGARNLTVSANSQSRVFLIASPLLSSNFTVNISGLKITGGNATPALIGTTLIGDGGGILNGALLGAVGGTSTLNLSDSVVTGNSTTTLGGGVATRLNSITNITRSLIANNTANPLVPVVDGSVGGGGVANTAGSTTTIVNSTITNNRSLAVGGGVLNVLGTTNLTNNTISNNSSALAGGGAASILGTANLRNTIIANNNDLLATNILGRDVFGVLGSFNSLGNNLIGSNFGAELNFTASAFVGVTPQPNAQLDLVGNVNVGNQVIDPLLGALQNNGGQTDTRLLFAGSPAIDRGSNCVLTNTCATNPQGNNPPTALTTDQRGAGFPRLVGAAVDIGATEGANTAIPLTVNSLLDNETDGCGINFCTLREAITEANSTTQADSIVFQPGLTGTIVLTNGQLVASTDMTISGPGARNLAVSGNSTDRVFLVATPNSGGDITVNISGLTIQDGFAQPVAIGSTIIGDGGGILNGALLGVISGTSTLNLSDITVDNNRATTLGGGVATRINAVTNITRSTISRNISNATIPALGGDVGGGGISNVVSITNVSNSTISNNNSLAAGGGILNAAGVINLTNNTISNNSSTVAGGGVVSTVGVLVPTLGVTNLRNTIIANNNDLLATNILGRDVFGVLGSFNSLGNNLIGSNFGAELNFTASAFVGVTPQPNAQLDLVGNVNVGNQVIDPLLGALQNNGGQTNTRAITASSPAFNKANNCVTSNSCSSGSPTALTTDQRGTGFNRLSGAAVDIGAYELQLGVTAAGVRISGRVMNFKGRGIEAMEITLTDANGVSRATRSNALGYYAFEDVEAGKMYVIAASGKRGEFGEQRYVFNVVEDMEGVNFISGDTSRLRPEIK